MKEGFRAGFVTLVGRSNVGKSTLMNRVVGMKIAITSPKPQTTRRKIRTVYTGEKGQVVFVDTPGMHLAKNKLSEYMEEAAEKSIPDVDLVLWVVEPSPYVGAGDRAIAEKLKASGKKVILVINKSDTVPKEGLLPVMDAYRRELPLTEILPVSARKGTGIDELIDAVIRELPESEPLYSEDTVTDETVRAMSAEIIREKALRNLRDEVPHGIAVEIESMKEGDSLTEIDASIVCERDSHKGIIIGKGGAMIKRIGTQSRKEIEELLEAHVNLQLRVKVRKDWRDNEMMLKSLGYNKKDL
ncbi:MAG: GTPase Era [Lachnospiraceae bacterium]|nr:GTPase Era [Lachnospiraceae bacterium]